ncbi:MAG: TonB-dependent receptor [Bryobacterales bacterium]|nr:TonB-dependent receptor [Bryobacterales bacterium]
MYRHLLLLALLSAPGAYSQEVRASITGTVTDSSGAPIPGVAITVTNIERNVSVSAASNSTGNYLTPFLAPGLYRVSAEQQGFKRFQRENIRLEAQDRARVDIVMELGDLAQSVTVSADVSLLQTETASRSQIIANELISQVPTQGRNPFQIAWAAPGVIKTGGWRYLRSFDIAGTSNFAVNGGRNKENEVLLDGISNVRGNRTVIHVPTMESVQEFKVVTNNYDAQYGRTGGGVVTIVTKSGGNDFHGTLFEYFQSEELNANQTELNRAGTRKPPNNINTFGFNLSGPVYIPKVFNGRDKLFWLLSYEGMRQRSADPGSKSMPLAEWRQGDFSTLFNAQGQQVAIYDPLTTRPDATRLPFAGNRIPTNRINPVAAAAFKYYPLPNSPGDGPSHVNNYIYPSRWIGNMDQWIGRMDYVINSKNTFYFRYGQNPFSEYRGLVFITNPFTDRNPAETTGNAPLVRNGRNFTFDWTSTLSPRLTFNLRAGLARWEENTGSSFGDGFDPRQLGFAPSLVSQLDRLTFPQINLGGYQGMGASRLRNVATDDSYTVQPNVNYAMGRHLLKFGAEGRRYNDNNNNPGLAAGFYNFDSAWTRANALRGDAVSGNEIASFLLGYPASAGIDKNINPAQSNQYFAIFFQDDWKLSQKLTLNLGLRWDYETPVVERYNRQLRGFDFTTASPIANQVTGLNLKGAVQFAGVNGQPRGAFNPDRNNFQPRIGIAYRVTDKWVVRGGYGVFYLGQNEIGSSQGFSRRTTAITSTDGGLTPAVSVDNAFANLPGGRLLNPIGSSLGGASFLGEGIAVNYLNRPLPYSQQYSFDIERELPFHMLAEVGYVGNATRKLPVNVPLNALPASELGRRTASGAIDSAYYTARVPNPMAGLIPNNAGLNGSTIPRQQLLYPFPQYSGISLTNVPIGAQDYHGFQSKLTKRMSAGFTFLASYGIGKTLERVSLLNPQDFNLTDPSSSRLEKRSAENIDIPQKFTIAGVFELPFGKGKTWGNSWAKPADLLLGGWQLNFDITYQSGWAIDYPNAAQVSPGSAKLSSGRTLDRWFNTDLWNNPATGARVPRQEPYTLREFPSRFGDVRVPGYQNWDASISKRFAIHENINAQFRFEMVNAFNHPWYTGLIGGGNDVASPNFGRLNFVQGNLPRFLKLGMHIYF